MKHLDLIGGHLNIIHENSGTLKTNFGACLSIIVTFLLALAIIAFGNDFFHRTNPKASVATVSPVDYPLYNITNKNFSFAIRFEDWDGIQVVKDDVLYFRPYYSYYKRNKTTREWKEMIWEPIPIVNCTKDMFNDERFANSADVQKMICMNLNNYTFGGGWDGDYVYSIYMNVEICTEGEYNPHNGKPCKSDLEKQNSNSFDEMMLSIFYPYTVIDITDYHNGLINVIKNDFFKIDKYLQKTKYLFFKETKLISDYGWIIKSNTTQNVLGFTSTYTDFNIKHNIFGEKLTGKLAQIILNGSRETDYINRNYEKIQTLVAEVGGVIKFSLFIFAFIGDKYAHIFTILKFEDILNYDKSSENNFNSNLNKGKLIKLHSNYINPINKHHDNSSNMQIDASKLKDDNFKKIEILNLNKKSDEVVSNFCSSHAQLNNSRFEPNHIDSIAIKNIQQFENGDLNKNLNIDVNSNIKNVNIVNCEVNEIQRDHINHVSKLNYFF